ncbi:MAG: FAD-binding oxidoreductase [Candidatus Acidiferrales bacterium]
MTLTASAVSSRLAEISGLDHVLENPAELAPYAMGARRPAAAVRPGTAAEAAEIVKFAAAEGFATVPIGARTKLSMSAPPRRFDLALDMTRLDRLLAYDPGDLTLGVEAGMPLARLTSLLAEHHQFLPLAVPFFAAATVGGTIASGMHTPLRQFYGAPRDYLLGMEFVTGEGKRAKSGGRVVKNVTGYDLHKLMIGAQGTLGAIVSINFRTFPMPGRKRALAARFDDAASALEMRYRIAASPLTPLTLDILSPGASQILTSAAAAQLELGVLPDGLLSAAHWTLTAGFAGNDAVLDRYTRDLLRIAEQSRAAHIATLDGPEVAAAFARQREFVAIALRSSPAPTILKIGVLPTKMKDVLDAAARATAESELSYAAIAAGLGIIHVALLPIERSEPASRIVRSAAAAIIAAAAAAGGHASIPWKPENWEMPLDAPSIEPAALAGMQRLKNLFDPRGILSPGRGPGGI